MSVFEFGTASPLRTRSRKGALAKRGLIASAAASVVFSLSGSAHAAIRTWSGGTGTWSSAANWGGTLPQSGDTISITQSAASVTFDSSSSISGALASLTIDNGAAIFQTADSLPTSHEVVGSTGPASFVLTGGTNSVTNTLTLGQATNSVGSYNLSGSAFLLVSGEIIGGAGTGVFTQTGGINSENFGDFTASLTLGTFGGTGTYSLSGTGALVISNQYVGGAGNGTFTQNGGVNSASNLVIGSSATLSSGVYTFEAGSFLANTLSINANGEFVQTGASARAPVLMLGSSGSAGATLSLQGGTLTANTETVNAGGYFVQSGGTNSVSTLLSVNGTSASYSLSGGALLTQTLSVNGNASFVENGGLSSAANVTIGSSNSTSATCSLQNGSFSATSLTVNAGGNFNWSGGSIFSGAINIATGGSFTVSGGGTRTIFGPVTNAGAFTATGTGVVFASTFTNNGAYISDPQDSHFTNLVVGQSGYLQAVTGDRFFISGNLTSTSTQASLWMTNGAELDFTAGGTGVHTLSINGADLGTTQISLYSSNEFSWGELVLDHGQSLTLVGGSSHAVYVDELLLADGISQISSIDSGGANIYYSANDAANSYLNDATYALTGGGTLAPIPEPACLPLLGLAGGVFVRRSRKRKSRA